MDYIGTDLWLNVFILILSIYSIIITTIIIIDSPPLLPFHWPSHHSNASYADEVKRCPVALLSVLCLQERLLALKRSMSFMQDMDFSQQAAILGDDDITAEIPPPEIIPIPVESAKKSKKQPVKDMKEVIR